MSCILKFIKVYGLLRIPRPFCNGLELWMGLPRNFKETVVKRSLLMRMEVDSLSLVRLSLVRLSLVLGHELVFFGRNNPTFAVRIHIKSS